jgi:3-oxoacyl-[acyl-carrier protein] reductase
MDLGIKGRVALITGASDGMGRGIALAFAREGVHLALCARSEDALEQVADEARKCGVTVFTRAVDVTDAAQVTAMVGATLQSLGHVDILVHCVGGSTKIGPLADVEDQHWTDSFDLNVLSGIRFTRALVPGMQERKWGRVVLISSIAGLQVTAAPSNTFVEYGTSKATLVALTKYASEHVASDNVLVNCICPGPILTPRSWGGMLPEEVVRKRKEMVPMKRLGTVEEVADLVLFLSSERCSYITGTAIPIDGGLSRALP